ncbi:MAG: hypothetical protein FP833_10490 [Atribacteria sp.]|nr:hypothetical protein [Candidatus Atribacteria bacterium]MBU4047246.1 hypothetical protein [bacterium]
MFQKLLKKISDELNTHNIPYMVIGGQAVLHYDAKYIKRWLQEFDKSLNEKFLKVFQRIVKEIR